MDLRQEITKLQKVEQALSALVARLEPEGYTETDLHKVLQLKRGEVKRSQEEESTMDNTASRLNVRIVELEVRPVASYRAVGESPEDKAWEGIYSWAEANGLTELPSTRFFGFNNPGPSKGESEYGYEFWVTLPEGFKPTGDAGIDVQFKEFPGGLFAVTATSLDTFDVGEKWRELARWLKQSKFEPIMGRCYEEHISPVP